MCRHNELLCDFRLETYVGFVRGDFFPIALPLTSISSTMIISNKQTKRKTTSYRSLFLIRIIFWSVNFRGSNWNFICSFFFIAVVHYYYCLVDCFICFLRLSWPTTNWGATGCNQPLNATEKSSSVSFFISVMDLKLISRVDLEPCAVRYIKRCGLSINERKIYQLWWQRTRERRINK